MNNDYGYSYRQQFLEEERINKRHQRQLAWLMLVAILYFGSHILYYFIR